MTRPAANLDDLTPQEQLDLLEEIWDRLSQHPAGIPRRSSAPSTVPWQPLRISLRRTRLFTAIGAACNLFGPHPMVDGGAVISGILGGGRQVRI